MKKEMVVFNEAAVLHLRLGLWHQFKESSSLLRKAAFCRWGVLRLLQPWRKKNDCVDYMFYCNDYLMCFNSLVVWPISRAGRYVLCWALMSWAILEDKDFLFASRLLLAVSHFRYSATMMRRSVHVLEKRERDARQTKTGNEINHERTGSKRSFTSKTMNAARRLNKPLHAGADYWDITQWTHII